MSAPAAVPAIRARPVLAPMRRPLRTGSGAVERAALVLIDFEADDGTVGRSYLFAIGPQNLKPFDVERTLRARHALLGGTPCPIRAYNCNGLGLMPPAELAREAEALLAEGFCAVKLRLGRPDARADLEAVDTVRRAIGPDATLMCDFNQSLTVNDAILRGRMIDDEGGMAWIEEPVRADDFAGTARIARELRTPVQIGENFMGSEQMAQALAAGCCDDVMPDAERIGGVTGWMRAAALAQAAGLEMSSHLFPEVSAHLLAVMPTAHWLEYVDWAAPVLADPIAPRDGHVAAPDVPGTGLVWDEDAVRRYAA
jgi:mandelate racemase